MSVLSLFTSARGVLIGTLTPFQPTISISGKPPSVIVGTSGTAGERLGLVMPSARNLPLCTCGTAACATTNIICTCPASTSVTAGATPLYGTCTMLIPADSLKSSAASWVVVPVPAEAKLSLPGCAFASCTSSASDFAGTAGCTTAMNGMLAISVTGAKSRTML